MSKATVEFGATDVNLNSTLEKTQRNLAKIDKEADTSSKGMESSFLKMSSAAAVGFGAVKLAGAALGKAFDVARGFVDDLGAALDMGGRLEDFSKRTGETAGNLLVLERAFDNTGVGADKVGQSVNKLQKFINDLGNGSTKNAETLGQLGLTFQDLQGKTPLEQFQTLAERITAIQDPTQRAGVAMSIFGKSGGALIPLLTNFSGELATARGQLGSLPGVMDRSSAAFDNISDNLAVIKGKTIEMAAGFLERATPAIERFTSYLTNVDAAAWGAKIMEAVMRITDGLIGAFRDPQAAVDILWLKMQEGAGKAMNFFANAWIKTTEAFKRVWTSNIPNELNAMWVHTWEIFGLYGARAWEALRSSSAINNYAAYVNTMFDNLWNGLTGKFDEINFVDTFKKYQQAGKAANAEIATEWDVLIGEATEKYKENMAESTARIGREWSAIADEISKSSQDYFGVADTTELIAEKTAKMVEDGKAWREAMTEGSGEVDQDLKNASIPAFNIAAMLKNAAHPLDKDTKAAKQNMIEINNLGDLIKAKNMAKPVGTFTEQVKEARKKMEELKDFIGGDFSKLSIPDIAERLGIDTTKKEQRELFQEIQAKLRQLENSQINVAVNKDATRDEFDKLISELAGKAVPSIEVPLNADSSIARIQTKLKEGVDVAINTSEGSKILEAVKTAVEVIRDTVKRIEPKLPMPALS